jgi:hypothetical protein
MQATNPLMQRFRNDARDFFKFLHVFDKDLGRVVPFILNEEQEVLLDALLEHNQHSSVQGQTDWSKHT